MQILINWNHKVCIKIDYAIYLTHTHTQSPEGEVSFFLFKAQK